MALILVIDDHDQMRRTVVRILQRAGHTSCEAHDGKEGVQLCRDSKPDLVITDLIMPEREAMETIRELRRDRPDLPIIAISGTDHPVYLKIAQDLGANASLQKPFAAEDLLALLDQLLGGSPDAAP